MDNTIPCKAAARAQLYRIIRPAGGAVWLRAYAGEQDFDVRADAEESLNYAATTMKQYYDRVAPSANLMFVLMVLLKLSWGNV